MFTGIVEEMATVQAVQETAGGRKFSFSASFAGALKVDQSVNVNGVCLTVEEQSSGYFRSHAIRETLRKTNLGALKTGSAVNVERAMSPSGRLDGHIVQGHVDTTGTVRSVTPEGESRLIAISYDPQYDPLVIPRGSIAIDGVSLTVARLISGELTVAMIPHSLRKTNAPDWQPGVIVNIEFDLLGKYVVRAMEAHGMKGAAKLTRSWLEEQGFG